MLLIFFNVLNGLNPFSLSDFYSCLGGRKGLNEEVPIILSKSVSDLGYFWMGGGHIHLKLGLAVSDFVNTVKNVKIMELSIPRNK